MFRRARAYSDIPGRAQTGRCFACARTTRSRTACTTSPTSSGDCRPPCPVAPQPAAPQSSSVARMRAHARWALQPRASHACIVGQVRVRIRRCRCAPGVVNACLPAGAQALGGDSGRAASSRASWSASWSGSATTSCRTASRPARSGTAARRSARPWPAASSATRTRSTRRAHAARPRDAGLIQQGA